MRLKKYFLGLLIITCISLWYVHISFLVVEGNYSIKKYEREISQLLDLNKKLMYNVTALETPACLVEKLVENDLEYDVPRRWAVARRVVRNTPYEVANVGKRHNAVFESVSNFITADAEAKTTGN